MNYSEYIAVHLDKSMDIFSKYLSEQIDNDIAYSEYIIERTNMKDPAQKKREIREKKLKRIFKDEENN